MNSVDAIEILERDIRARYPVIAVISHEEARVVTAIEQIAKARKMKVAQWSITTGLTGIDDVDPRTTREPAPAFDRIMEFTAPVNDNTETAALGRIGQRTLFLFKDLHGFLGNKDRGFQPVLTRWLRDIAARFEVSQHSLILVSPAFQLPPDLDKTIAVIDWPLPSAEELAGILHQAEVDMVSGFPVTLNGNRDQVVQALQGLTAFEANQVLASGVVATQELGESVIPHVIREKSQIIKKSGVLEYFDNKVTMQDVGGLDELKTYASKKRKAFSADAASNGVDSPRAVLLVGVPGTGKSLSAKAIAGMFRMPLLRMDVGALMGGLVGQSESNTRNALKVSEAVAPCVLWIDEIEKALGSGGGEHDGGTHQRVFGTILTWMQERTAPVYVVATANDVSALAPELISRFDDVIFVDLPAAEARRQIVKVHLEKRGYKGDYPNHGDEFNTLIDALWGFSGREIEKVVRSAIESAYFNEQTLTIGHLLIASAEIVPVMVTMKSKIETIRNWVRSSQARQADIPLEPKPEVRSPLGRKIDFS